MLIFIHGRYRSLKTGFKIQRMPSGENVGGRGLGVQVRYRQGGAWFWYVLGVGW